MREKQLFLLNSIKAPRPRIGIRIVLPRQRAQPDLDDLRHLIVLLLDNIHQLSRSETGQHKIQRNGDVHQVLAALVRRVDLHDRVHSIHQQPDDDVLAALLDVPAQVLRQSGHVRCEHIVQADYVYEEDCIGRVVENRRGVHEVVQYLGDHVQQRNGDVPRFVAVEHVRVYFYLLLGGVQAVEERGE